MAARGRKIECWYQEYWAQTWYANTYLVNHPRQIARETGGVGDWNNVYDSGCNFVCLAMMIGIDPARLASLLASHRFFKPDRASPARSVAGKKGLLVWDCNEPARRDAKIALRNIWHQPTRRRMHVVVRYEGREVTTSHAKARKLVSAARRRGFHVICGPDEHSHLVAGRADGDFYLWDPDESELAVEDALAGRMKLADLYALYTGQPIELWLYSVTRMFAKRG